MQLGLPAAVQTEPRTGQPTRKASTAKDTPWGTPVETVKVSHAGSKEWRLVLCMTNRSMGRSEPRDSLGILDPSRVFELEPHLLVVLDVGKVDGNQVGME